MDSDNELLLRFARDGEAAAFYLLVARHADMVRGVALRSTEDVTLAEEVTQTVFAVLARKASRLAGVPLAAWLHHCALLESRNARRKAARYRRVLERYRDHMNASHAPDSSAADAEALRPHLDAAVARLPEAARQLLVLRFYEGCAIRDIASATGRTEAACRKMLQRALDRLGKILRRRGLPHGTAALVAVFSGLSISLPPANAATLAAGALKFAPSLTSATLFTHTLHAMNIATSLKTASAVALLAAIPITLLWQNNNTLKDELRAAKTAGLALPHRSAAPSAPAPAAAADAKADVFKEFALRTGLDASRPLEPEKMRAAIVAAMREDNPLRRHQIMARLLESLTPQNAASALAALRESADEWEAARFTDMVAYAWGSVDPQGAMAAFAKERGWTAAHNKEMVLSAWATHAPAEATAWLENLDPREKGRFTGALIEGLAASDPSAAFRYAQTLTTPESKHAAGDALARQMLKSGPDAATAWVQSLTDPDLRRGAFGSVAEQLQRTDLGKAMEFVKSYAAEPYAVGQIGSIAEAAGRQDVEKGLEFALSIQGGAQSKALGEVIGEWMERGGGRETLQASEYVSKLPPGVDRDHSAWAIANRMVEDDAPAAIAWAQSIADEGIKTQALMDVAWRFRASQPEAFAKWLPTSGLSEEVQKHFTGGGAGAGAVPQ